MVDQYSHGLDRVSVLAHVGSVDLQRASAVHALPDTRSTLDSSGTDVEQPDGPLQSGHLADAVSPLNAWSALLHDHRFVRRLRTAGRHSWCDVSGDGSSVPAARHLVLLALAAIYRIGARVTMVYPVGQVPL